MMSQILRMGSCSLLGVVACLASTSADAQTATDTFQVLLTIEASCTVTAGTASDIDLGTVPSTATDVSDSNTFTVNCSNTTPYFIGLEPSNGDTGGAGLLTNAGPDSVPYQLEQDAAGTIWGNTATSTSVGNGVAGIGTGADEPFTVFATVPSANFAPGDYSDTVTINVNF